MGAPRDPQIMPRHRKSSEDVHAEVTNLTKSEESWWLFSVAYQQLQ